MSSDGDDGSGGGRATVGTGQAGEPDAGGGGDRPQSSRQALVTALDVPRYARLSAVFAAVFAVAVAVFFVVVVSGGRTDFPLAYYPFLAFVVFVTSGMLTLATLVGRRVLRLAVHPASIVRKSATGGLLAGLTWLAAAAGLAFGPGRPWAPIVDAATPWAALLTPLGLWAVWTRYKRTAPARPLAALGVLAALGGALVLADLAAFELVSLLPDVGGAVDPAALGLFRAGAVVTVGGLLTFVTLAALGEGPELPLVALFVGPLLGLAGFLSLAPGRPALAVLAAGLGISWSVACWRLRGATEDGVPTGPEPVLDGSS